MVWRGSDSPGQAGNTGELRFAFFMGQNLKILVTGRGTSGSWQVRGVQLGQACGARVKANANDSDASWADVVVVVKRASIETINAIRKSNKPWLFDAVDFYPQPTCTHWDRNTAIGWVRAQIEKHRPTGVIWPNQRMREDCDTGLPGMVLYHHCRPDYSVNPIRETVSVIGYEGSPFYIGEWIDPILRECLERGWEFRTNQGELADWDIVIAARGEQSNGYVQRHWKSNVKLANAHGTGTPFIGPEECGYTETASGLEQWANKPRELRDCMDRLTEQHHRQQVQKAFLAQRYSLEQAARDLMRFIEGIR